MAMVVVVHYPFALLSISFFLLRFFSSDVVASVVVMVGTVVVIYHPFLQMCLLGE